MLITLPLTKRFRILKKLFKPAIIPEAYFAYFHRLPDEIQAEWFRDDGFIVGRVRAGGKEFVTQGADADDFIRMVNECVATVFDIPEDYADLVTRTRTFLPSPADRRMLDDKSVTRRSFGFVKHELTFKVA